MNQAVIRISTLSLAALLLAAAGPACAQVYKVVDENGNVVYTDRPPGNDAQPMDLPGLSVIGMIRSNPAAESEGAAEEDGEQEAVTSIRALRRGYRDFEIVNPVAEETYWGIEGEVALAWNTRYRLQPGMRVVFYVDGEAREPTTAEAVTVNRLERGAHTVYAELVDARNRKIATTQPVTFYVQQYSINYGANRQGGPGRG